MGQCTMDRPPDSAIHIHVLVVSDVGLSEGSKRASAAYASAGGPYRGESCSARSPLVSSVLSLTVNNLT